MPDEINQEKKDKISRLNDDSDLVLLDEIEGTKEGISDTKEKLSGVFQSSLLSILDKVPKVQPREKINVNLVGVKVVTLKGEKGDKGEQGLPGKSGRDGADGKNGKDGRNGTDGQSGQDGLDGSPDSPEEIRDKLEKLKGNDRLDKKAIKGLEDEFSRDKIRAEILAMGPFGGGSRSSGGGTPAGVLGDIQINKPAGTFGALSGARLHTTGNTAGTNALDLQSDRGLNTQVASGQSATAVGQGNTASGAFSVAIGYANESTALDASSYGVGSHALGVRSTASGYANYANTDNSAAIGFQNNVTGTGSAAFGTQNLTNADNSFTFGSNMTNATSNTADIGVSDTSKGTFYNTGVQRLTGDTLPIRWVMANIFSQTTPVQISNVDAETNMIGAGVGTLTLPAGFFSIAGRKVKVILKGRVKGDASTTMQLRAYLTSTLLIDSGAIVLYNATGVSSVADYGSFTIEIDITCTADGTVYANGDFRYAFSTKAGVIWGLLMGTVPVTFSSGSAYDVVVTAQFGTATPNVDIVTETVEVYVSQGDAN